MCLSNNTLYTKAYYVSVCIVSLCTAYMQLILLCLCFLAAAIGENETCDEESNIPIAEKTTIETMMVDDCSKLTSQTVASAPEMKQTTGSSMSSAADEPYESVSTILLKCGKRKPEIEKLFADRKLIVISAADIRRPRSADIFRADHVTSGLATARAQSETRDVTVSWNAPSKDEHTCAQESLTSSVGEILIAYVQLTVVTKLSRCSGPHFAIYTIVVLS